MYHIAHFSRCVCLLLFRLLCVSFTVWLYGGGDFFSFNTRSKERRPAIRDKWKRKKKENWHIIHVQCDTNMTMMMMEKEVYFLVWWISKKIRPPNDCVCVDSLPPPTSFPFGTRDFCMISHIIMHAQDYCIVIMPNMWNIIPSFLALVCHSSFTNIPHAVMKPLLYFCCFTRIKFNVKQVHSITNIIASFHKESYIHTRCFLFLCKLTCDSRFPYFYQHGIRTNPFKLCHSFRPRNYGECWQNHQTMTLKEIWNICQRTTTWNIWFVSFRVFAYIPFSHGTYHTHLDTERRAEEELNANGSQEI